MRVEGRYDTKSHAKLALRRWRGLYGDPEADFEDRFFRVRYVPKSLIAPWKDQCPWAVVSFTDREEADAVTAQGEVKA